MLEVIQLIYIQGHYFTRQQQFTAFVRTVG